MKKYIKIVLPFIVLFYSCNEKTNDKRIIASSQLLASKTVEKKQPDKIIGKYFVVDFHNYLRSGFELKNKKPKDQIVLYSFKFKENGELIFEDLTKFYGCGNGILSIDKGQWRVNENGFYELTFDGEYALESLFYTQSEYTLVELKNGNLELKLNKVLVNEKKEMFER